MINKRLSIILLITAIVLFPCTLQLYLTLTDFELSGGYSEVLVEIGGFGSVASLILMLFFTKKGNRSRLIKWTIRINILSLVNIVVVWIIAIFLILTGGPIRI